VSSYSGARAVAALIGFLGWAGIVLSVFGGTVTFQRVGLMPALTMALPVAFAGLLLIAVGQIVMAQLDTAENTGAMVRMLNEIKSSQSPSAQFGGRAPGSPLETYKGRLITSERNGVSVAGQQFATIDAAKSWIDIRS